MLHGYGDVLFSREFCVWVWPHMGLVATQGARYLLLLRRRGHFACRSVLRLFLTTGTQEQQRDGADQKASHGISPFQPKGAESNHGTQLSGLRKLFAKAIVLRQRIVLTHNKGVFLFGAIKAGSAIQCPDSVGGIGRLHGQGAGRFGSEA
jgi:hypothetical protein